MKTFLFLFLVISQAALGFSKVENFVERRRLLVTLDMEYDLAKGDKIIILTQEKQELVAIGNVTEILVSDTPHRAVVDVVEILGSNQIMVGDAVEKLNPDNLKRYHVPGYFSLVLGDNEKVPSKYKDLAYMGVFNSDGHTLAKNEWLVSLTSVQYGISNPFTIKATHSLYLDGYANLGFKSRLMKNRFGHLTMNGLLARQINRPDWASSLGLILTMPSNEKFQSHLIINANLEGLDEDKAEVKKLNIFPDSDVRTIYEYVTDDWNRFLFGPSFNFETRTVGGTLSYMWIWDTFHLNLGLGSKDVSELEFKSGGYYLLFDFFWRF